MWAERRAREGEVFFLSHTCFLPGGGVPGSANHEQVGVALFNLLRLKYCNSNHVVQLLVMRNSPLVTPLR